MRAELSQYLKASIFCLLAIFSSLTLSEELKCGALDPMPKELAEALKPYPMIQAYLMRASRDVVTNVHSAVRELERITSTRDLRKVISNLYRATETWPVKRLAIDILVQDFLSQEDAVRDLMIDADSDLKQIYRENWAAEPTGQIISTRPSDLVAIEQRLRARPTVERFIDIGSGHGLPMLLLAMQFPNIQFDGYDLVEAKVRMANRMARRLGLTNVHFHQQDLGDRSFKLPVADAYYLFNPVNPDVLRPIADQLSQMSRMRRAPIQIFSLTWGDGWVAKAFMENGCSEKQLELRGSVFLIICNDLPVQ